MTFFLQICGRTLPYICKENVNKTGQKTARISFFFRHFSLEKSPIFAPKRTRFFGRILRQSCRGRCRFAPEVLPGVLSEVSEDPPEVVRISPEELHAGYYARAIRAKIVRNMQGNVIYIIIGIYI